MTPDLSIIIPAYNCSNFIARCINSIFSLPWKENQLEVIIIDDCSTDDTKSVIRLIQKEHNNIILIEHNRNKRLGAARNSGLNVAKGKYVMFCDADDEIGEGVLCALNKAQKYKLDICFYTLNLEKDDGTFMAVKWTNFPCSTIVDGMIFLNQHFDFYVNGSTRGVIARDIIEREQLRYEEFVRWEDGDFCIKLYKRAQAIGTVNEVGYFYYRNMGSINFTITGSAIGERIGLGCRLIKLADSEFVKTEPIYQKIVEEAQWRYFKQNLRLRNLTKISWQENLVMHKHLTKEDWKLVSQYANLKWERLVCKQFTIASALLFFACPIAKIGRWITNNKRALCKKQ